MAENQHQRDPGSGVLTMSEVATLRRVAHSWDGNGNPALPVRLDRMERAISDLVDVKKSISTWGWRIVGAVVLATLVLVWGQKSSGGQQTTAQDNRVNVNAMKPDIAPYWHKEWLTAREMAQMYDVNTDTVARRRAALIPPFDDYRIGSQGYEYRNPILSRVHESPMNQARNAVETGTNHARAEATP